MKKTIATKPGEPCLHVECTDAEIAARLAEEALVVQKKIAALPDKIRDLAGKKILALAPEWKQRNMIARSVELMEQGGPSTPQEEAEMAGMKQAWALVKAIRAHSDVLGNQLVAAEDPLTVDIEAGWPGDDL